jgi:hypothetical protein
MTDAAQTEEVLMKEAPPEFRAATVTITDSLGANGENMFQMNGVGNQLFKSEDELSDWLDSRISMWCYNRRWQLNAKIEAAQALENKEDTGGSFWALFASVWNRFIRN